MPDLSIPYYILIGSVSQFHLLSPNNDHGVCRSPPRGIPEGTGLIDGNPVFSQPQLHATDLCF